MANNYFWTIVDIIQRRYGEPTDHDISEPHMTWGKGDARLYINGYDRGTGCDYVSVCVMQSNSVVSNSLLLFFPEDGDTENLRALYRHIGSSRLAPMWEFLDEHFSKMHGKPIEAIHHDDIITEGDI